MLLALRDVCLVAAFRGAAKMLKRASAGSTVATLAREIHMYQSL